MEISLCKLCDKPNELKHSHVIGKSVFRSLNKSSGKHYGILTDFENDKIVRSTDQWATTMLCSDCESFLNNRYENYSLWSLKNKQHGVKHLNKSNHLTIQNVNQKRLMMYVISIFWRAAVSTHIVFKKIVISQELNEYLKRCILGEVDIDTKLFSVKISKLVVTENFYHDEIINGLITNLVQKPVNKGKSYVMVFLGFYFEIFYENLTPMERYKDGVLRINKTTLNMPYIDMLGIKEIVDWLQATRKIAYRDKDKLDFLNL